MKAKSIPCPLCKNNHHDHIDSINISVLKDIWNSNNIDISNMFNNLKSLNYYKCNNCSLGFFNPQISGDNDFYSQLGQDKLNYDYYEHGGKTEFEYAKKIISPGSIVLDIGSGVGAFSSYLDAKAEYTGIEFSSKAVEIAERNNVNVIKSTIEEYVESSKKKFDFIVVFQVLEHIEDIHSFIKSAKSILKDEGKLIIAVPNNDSFISNTPNHILNLPPHHILHWNKKSLEQLAIEFKLSVNDIFYEKVSDEHSMSFYFSMIDSFFKKMFFISPRLIKISVIRSLLSKISWRIAAVLMFLKIRFYNKCTGQTIIISMQNKKI
jgi:2-polyprenyl-3-methyl-5-hydroxy-6-metoxy-1,4-benzoquinol methylase